jgi:protein-tyrosine kinase
MERLQEAIARARAERAGEIGKLPRYDKARPAVGSSAAAAPAGSAAADASATRGSDASQQARRPAPGTPPAITYTHTRVVQLDPQVLEKNRVIAGAHDDRRVEVYRQLRTQVLQTLAQNGWSNLAITSPTENAGKTLTSVNLAISLSQDVNHTVLLVDLDITKPEVHTTLGVAAGDGIFDVAEGRASMEQVLFNPGMPRLVVLPGRPTGQPSSEALTSPGMLELLREMTRRYPTRIVIFDLPPLLRNDDALTFTPYADATLMVVEDGVNTPAEIERSLHLMKHANFIGTILNKAQL